MNRQTNGSGIWWISSVLSPGVQAKARDRAMAPPLSVYCQAWGGRHGRCQIVTRAAAEVTRYKLLAPLGRGHLRGGMAIKGIESVASRADREPVVMFGTLMHHFTEESIQGHISRCWRAKKHPELVESSIAKSELSLKIQKTSHQVYRI